MWKCPRCKCESLRVVHAVATAESGLHRIECAKCGRFAKWGKDERSEPKEVETTKPDNEQQADEQSKCATTDLRMDVTAESWLYVSKRLDLDWLPNAPMWCAPAVSLGSTLKPRAFYRVTPRVLVWLEWAGELLQQQFTAGKLERAQLDVYCERMTVVWEFARNFLSRTALDELRAKSRREEPTLPDFYCPL